MPDPQSKLAVWGRRLGWSLFWLVMVLEVLSMWKAGSSKFRNFAGWQTWFVNFGYPAWMSPIVGGVEVVGASLILIPRIASYVAPVLGVIMIGALHAVLTHETALGWFDPALHLVFLTIIGFVRWNRRWRPRTATE